MSRRLQKLLLFAAAAGIAAFLFLDKPERSAGVASVGRDAAPGADASRPSADSLQLPGRPGLNSPRNELFGAPPPPPKPAPAVVSAPAPVAPPVPYRYAGKLRDDTEEHILLSKGDAVFRVTAGETLEGTYRVEAIGTDRIELRYLPLGTIDRIAVNSALDALPARSQLAAAVAASPPAAAPATPAAAPAPAAGEGKPAQLRWEGPARVEAGASFSVALRVNTSEPLRAAPMQLRFEPEVLEAVNVQPGKFFGQGSFSYRVNAEGSIFVGATSPAAAPGADAELVIVTFRPLKRGATAQLSMGALNLQGAAGRAIAHEQVSAFRTAIQ